MKSPLCVRTISRPNASRPPVQELEAVVTDTEKATEVIMSAAESVLCDEETDYDTYRANVEAKMMEIIESCSFQDLAGQRVSKVVGSLRHVERTGLPASPRSWAFNDADGGPQEETAEEKRNREQLLNGPAIGGPETSQDDIDAMFCRDGWWGMPDLDQGSGSTPCSTRTPRQLRATRSSALPIAR